MINDGGQWTFSALGGFFCTELFARIHQQGMILVEQRHTWGKIGHAKALNICIRGFAGNEIMPL